VSFYNERIDMYVDAALQKPPRTKFWEAPRGRGSDTFWDRFGDWQARSSPRDWIVSFLATVGGHKNEHIRNDTRDVSRRMVSAYNVLICRRKRAARW
jgi:hypothetical protein